MLNTFLSDLRQFTRKLQVRIILIAALSPMAVILAKVIGPMISLDLTRWIGADAVDPILQIIANSMLAVTIFALTMMTAAFRAVSTQWTPRAHLVMMEDTVTQNVLATFLGSWLFALTAIILRSSEVFGDNEKVVLFAFTIVVVLLVVLAMTRWILHLETLGSLIETCRRVEERATEAIRARAADPGQGARLIEDAANVIPESAIPMAADLTGHVQSIAIARLQELAEDYDCRVYVTVEVGQFVFAGDPLAFIERAVPDVGLRIPELVRVGTLRTFTEDPRHGLVVLSEIASRALSPGVNDPGTAIDVLRRLGRVLADYQPVDRDAAPPRYDRVWVLPLSFDDLFEDAFDPVSRYAGAAVEVHVTLQKVLAGLARQPHLGLSRAAESASLRALERAEAAIGPGSDLERLHAALSPRLSSRLERG